MSDDITDTGNQLGTTLKFLLRELNMNESQLARKTGIGQPVIHRMASGETENPKIKTLVPVAKFFGISISQLIGEEPLPNKQQPGSFLTSRQWAGVPLLEWDEAVNWNELDKSKLARQISVDVRISDDSFALRVRDSSMKPLFPEGTLIVVDPAAKPQNRDFVVVHLADQKWPVFKQLLVDGDDMYLKPLNPDFRLTHLDKPHKILGVVVQGKLNFRDTILNHNF